MRVLPPVQYADEFVDLPQSALTLPEGSDGVKFATWWKSASVEQRRTALHDARTDTLHIPEEPLVCDLVDVEYDDDDDDILFADRFGADDDEYGDSV